MAVFGVLDELRHTQIDLFFAHDFVAQDPQYDWAQKAMHTNEWGALAARAFFDGLSYSNRRRLVESIEGAKSKDTRDRRIAKSVASLHAGRTS
jgi:uncharacterized protein YdeI (YjbR/CyaY-like superfamily)